MALPFLIQLYSHALSFPSASPRLGREMLMGSSCTDIATPLIFGKRITSRVNAMEKYLPYKATVRPASQHGLPASHCWSSALVASQTLQCEAVLAHGPVLIPLSNSHQETPRHSTLALLSNSSALTWEIHQI